MSQNWQHVLRDNHGRWANTPGAGEDLRQNSPGQQDTVLVFNNDEVSSQSQPVEKPDWQPSMSREDAESWVEGSAITYDVYHATTSPDAASSIKSQKSTGFDLSNRVFGRLWGDGVYAATSLSHGRHWWARLGGGQGIDNPQLLRLKVMVDNPMVINVSDWSQEEREQDFFGRVDMVDKKHEGFGKGFKKSYPKRLREVVKSKEGGDPFALAISDAARELGYDSIFIEDVDAFRLSSGGQQIVVFDPKKVVVINE